MTKNKLPANLKPQIPEPIQRLLQRRAILTGDLAEDPRAMFVALNEELRPQGLVEYSMTFRIANLMCALHRLQSIRDTTFNQALREAVEECLKDTPAKDPASHAKYALSGAKADATRWAKNARQRLKINARLKKAGYDQADIKARAHSKVQNVLAQIDQDMALTEERLRRELRQAAERINVDAIALIGMAERE